MSREIKFRAWDKEKKYMVEHTYLACYILKEILEYPDFELMQFTGLKDKNGKEVYVGDIVETNAVVSVKFKENTSEIESEEREIKRWTIEFSRGSFWLNGEYSLEIWRQCNLSGGIDSGRTWFEVIGNFYETPELLPF